MSENEEWESYGSLEYRKKDIQLLRKFVRLIESSKTEEEANKVFDKWLETSDFSEEDLQNVWNNCVDWNKVKWENEGSEEAETEEEKTELSNPSKKVNFFSVFQDETSSFIDELNVIPKWSFEVEDFKRKISDSGDSKVVTIPKILNGPFPRGYGVLVLCLGSGRMLLFYPSGSFMAKEHRENIKGFDRKLVTLRSVLGSGKLNCVPIPTQFLKYFDLNKKVTVFFESSDGFLGIESNLSDNELEVLNKKESKVFVADKGIKEMSVKSKPKILPISGRCVYCGMYTHDIRFWYEGQNKGVPLCSGCYREYEERNHRRTEFERKQKKQKNHMPMVVGLVKAGIDLWKSRGKKKESRTEPEPRI